MYKKPRRYRVRRVRPKKTPGSRVPKDMVEQLVNDLLAESTLDQGYIALIFGSCALATFGLLSNSAAVIIGAMIVAPLMLPIRGIAFGALEGEGKLLREGLKALIVGIVVAIALACLISLSVGLPTYGSEVWARSSPTLLDLGVAVVAGGISGYAKVQPKISSAVAGTAIAVALMPPVCVIGLGLAQGDWELSQGATLLFCTNLFGITLSCMLTFLAAGYTPLSRARRAIAFATASTAVLLFPLLGSLLQLITQSRLEKSVQNALQNRTITFERAQIIESDVNWLANPPEVLLIVSSAVEITPKQVRLLETFIEQEMGRPFRLVLELSQVRRVEREPVARLISIPTYHFWEAISGNQLSNYASELPRFVSSNFELERSQVLATEVDWQAEPPQLKLIINASKPVTAAERSELEQIYTQAMDELFELSFEVQRPELSSSGSNRSILVRGFNFDQVRQKADLEAKLYTSFRELELLLSQGQLINSQIDWSELRPRVLLTVDLAEPITERQSRLYQDFIFRKAKRPINLEIENVARPVDGDRPGDNNNDVGETVGDFLPPNDNLVNPAPDSVPTDPAVPDN
ncbi:protein of unknown function DUF389 [Thalassoporum mexicanum PCC 7367]|uniref:DUF389 domain-containing protein n=1 Tax=Thalassoporum mexicanum TaxID=3457544 RepID=UPI00029FDAB8|nr:DUF389 domain-containing protein [Pseudanabaena sp. PCC 7367]AFY71785.1 protein of unknown function DUF389 [Pseudanabaena sp. PCC 7367]